MWQEVQKRKKEKQEKSQHCQHPSPSGAFAPDYDKIKRESADEDRWRLLGPLKLDGFVLEWLPR